MAGFSREAAIIISIIMGIIILPILGISGIFSIIIIGFVANYLTVRNQRSYKVGGIAGGILGLMIFIYGFVSPQIPDLPNISGFEMIGLTLGGLFTLLLGFILLIGVSVAFGSLGGLIAEKILKKRSKISERDKRKTRSPKRFSSEKSRRSLNRR